MKGQTGEKEFYENKGSLYIYDIIILNFNNKTCKS